MSHSRSVSIDDEPGPSISPHVLDVDITFPSGNDINNCEE